MSRYKLFLLLIQAIRGGYLKVPFEIGKDDSGGLSCSTTASAIDNDEDTGNFTLIIGGTSNSQLFFTACLPEPVPFLMFVSPNNGLAT